jgi:TrmH RNA methyltransferase
MKDDTICGLNAVAALFARRPDDVQRLFYTPAMRGRVGRFCERLAASRRPYRMLEPEPMEKAAGTPHHGGIAAVAKPRPFSILHFDAPPRVPLLLALDGVGNPHNLGAIARSAAFFGVRALLLHEVPGQAMPSDAAYRVAEGGLEFLDVYRTRDLPGAVRAMAPLYRSVAAGLSPQAAPLGGLPRDRPILLVLGNEETGVSPDVLAACRREVRIPGSGQVQSLNVAQAAAVLLHALTGLSEVRDAWQDP